MEITLSSENIKQLVVKHISSLDIGNVEDVKFIKRKQGQIEAVINIQEETNLFSEKMTTK